ncbi:hypothetical protein BDZ97DRAFT_1861893, partial [Flammula alnicola]
MVHEFTLLHMPRPPRLISARIWQSCQGRQRGFNEPRGGETRLAGAKRSKRGVSEASGGL